MAIPPSLYFATNVDQDNANTPDDHQTAKNQSPQVPILESPR